MLPGNRMMNSLFKNRRGEGSLICCHPKVKFAKSLSVPTHTHTPQKKRNNEVLVKQTRRSDAIIPPPPPHPAPHPPSAKNKSSTKNTKNMEFAPRAAVGGPTTSGHLPPRKGVFTHGTVSWRRVLPVGALSGWKQC